MPWAVAAPRAMKIAAQMRARPRLLHLAELLSPDMEVSSPNLNYIEEEQVTFYFGKQGYL